jgi:hypothetical protein
MNGAFVATTRRKYDRSETSTGGSRREEVL